MKGGKGHKQDVLASSVTEFKSDWKFVEHNEEKRVNTLCPYSKSPQAMDLILESFWREFTPETINKLIDSMQKRAKAVIKARGGPIKY